MIMSFAADIVQGPPVEAAPVRREERISMLDVLRGFALLGILVVNIDDFASPQLLHDIPIGGAIDSLGGPHAQLNFLVLLAKWVFVEGKMRGLFSMLFGAGVVLMTERAEQRGAGAGIADIYLRRNMLLVLFGFLHGVLIWHGDILFLYGLAALLVVYPFRKMAATSLVALGLVLSVVGTTIGLFAWDGGLDDIRLHDNAVLVAAREKAGETVTPEQKADEKAWNERLDHFRPTPEKTKEAMDEAAESYGKSVAARLDDYFGPGSSGTIGFFVFEAASAMLLGMGLFKCGFLTGRMSDRVYLWTAVAGAAVSASLTIVGLIESREAGFDFFVHEEWVYAPYFLCRTAGMLALAALVILAVRHEIWRSAQRRLAAVGRTALSNYLMTSLLCQFVFVWGPWPLYGQLDYYQLCGVVAAVWALNLGLSPIWLRHFEFGPFEWVWRSLTYLKPQRLRIATSVRV